MHGASVMARAPMLSLREDMMGEKERELEAV
ncbi:hypothetical protein N7471_010272, partial [Penicillium samsonianum]